MPNSTSSSSWPSLEPPTWMSLWEKYFAPGDLRQRQRKQEAEAATALQNETQRQKQPLIPKPPQRIDAAHRARRQNALLYGGLAFTAFSVLITRRSLRRKQAHANLAQITPSSSSSSSTAAAIPPDAAKSYGALDAIHALNLATLNVFSVAMATAGVVAKYFDLADIEDLRDGVRKAAGYDVYSGDAAADQEMEVWVAEVLANRDEHGQGGLGGLEGLKEGLAGKIAELQRRDREKEKEMELGGKGEGR